MAMGTPEYMAPEQAAGRQADERCDVYALGAILYEMLTGVPPYQGENFMEILTKKATVDPVPAHVLRGTIPETVNQLVQQAMARNPDDRPRSMEAFEYELTKCLAGRGLAVAQMLGMSTDAGLMAQLNPGIVPRSFEETPISEVSGVPPGVRPGSSQPPSAQAQAAASAAVTSALGVPARPATYGFETPSIGAPRAVVEYDNIEAASASLSTSRAGRVFGWLFLTALILGGLGVVLYVAVNERGGEATGGAAADLKAAAALDAAAAVPVDATPAKPQGSGTGSAAPTKDKDDDKDHHADHDKDKHPKDKVDKPEVVDVTGVPASADEAKRVLAQADGLMAKGDWDAAFDAYQRLSKSSYNRRDAYLGMAKASWQQGRIDRTIQYAQQAVKLGAGDDAKKMLGHAYKKNGNYAQALIYYDEILKHDPKNNEVRDAANEARKQMH
jgi:hypothetical protein